MTECLDYLLVTNIQEIDDLGDYTSKHIPKKINMRKRLQKLILQLKFIILEIFIL